VARIFTSFAMEDKSLRDLLVGQRHNTRNAIEFTDYSVKVPWETKWKTNCRERIRLCSGVIGIITGSTSQAEGQLWELRCAIDEQKPVLLIHGYSNLLLRASAPPPFMRGHRIFDWTEANIVRFIDSL